MKKRGVQKKKNIANTILIIGMILALIFIIFSFARPISEKFEDIWSGLKGELATLGSGTISVSQGLVAYYKFEGNLLDSSGNNYNGNPIGNVSYGTGVSGQATNYDGSGDGVSMGNVLNFGTTDFTASFWFNPTQTKNQRIFMKRGGTCGCAGGGFWEFGIDTNKKIWFYVYDGPSCGPNSVNLPSASTYNINTWYYVTGVRQGNKVSLYINGTLQGTKQTTGIANVNNIGNLMIGDSKCSNADFSGKFDEVKIWNRALTPLEIIKEYTPISITRKITINRFTGNNVVLSILKYRPLGENEIIMIAEELPAGLTMGSSSISPTYKDGNILVWLFSSNSEAYFGEYNLSVLPNSITYTFSGSTSGIKGKWALKNANEEGVIN